MNTLITLTALAAVFLFAVEFCCYSLKRLALPMPASNPCEVGTLPDPWETEVLSCPLAAEQPVYKVVQPMYLPAAPSTVAELRAVMTQRGLRWNRAGKGKKHLSKAEMMARLYGTG